MDEFAARVLTLATHFRDGLEQLPPGKRSIALREFPRGSCGDVVDLLGTYLYESGAGEFFYVHGEWWESGGGYHSHAWLERDGLIVDITGDQFPGGHERVIVTRSSSWHSSFESKTVRIADYRRGGSPEMVALDEVYHYIVSRARAV